jgi:hypothetical protein
MELTPGMMRSTAIAMLFALCALSSAQARKHFTVQTDLLIFQFDSKPDEDDIHTQAAVGCMLAHNSFSEIKYYAVAGAVGTQGGSFIDSTALFNMAFGPENDKWTNAHLNWSASVTRIKNQAKSVLQAGGNVWVQEAGQSNITADWIAALISDGVSERLIKSNVIVVQHSDWNQDKTSPADLSYVKAKATYYKIDDGNQAPGSGPLWTPKFRASETSYLTDAKSSMNATAKALWTEADRICDTVIASWENQVIKKGGVDFSDTVELWWTLCDEKEVADISSFWNKYVVNNPDAASGEAGNTL